MNKEIVITLNNAGFLTGMARSQAAVNTVCAGIRNMATQFAGLYGVSTGVRGAIEGLRGAFAWGGQLKELSDRTSISVQDLVVLRQAFESTGVGADAATVHLTLMQKALGGVNADGEPTNKAFEALGLNLSTLRGMGTAQQLQAIAAALRGVQDPARQTAMTLQIFGRGGGAMKQFILDPGAIDEARSALGRLPSILQQNAMVFHQLDDAMGEFRTNARGVWVGVAETVAPALRELLGVAQGADSVQFGRKLGESIDIVVQAFAALARTLREHSALIEMAVRGLMAYGAAMLGLKISNIVQGMIAWIGKAWASATAVTAETAAVKLNTQALIANAAARAAQRTGSVPGMGPNSFWVPASQNLVNAAGIGPQKSAFLGAPSIGGALSAVNIGAGIGSMVAMLAIMKSEAVIADANQGIDANRGLHRGDKDIKRQVDGISSLADKEKTLQDIRARTDDLKKRLRYADSDQERGAIKQSIAMMELYGKKVQGLSDDELRAKDAAAARAKAVTDGQQRLKDYLSERSQLETDRGDNAERRRMDEAKGLERQIALNTRLGKLDAEAAQLSTELGTASKWGNADADGTKALQKKSDRLTAINLERDQLKAQIKSEGDLQQDNLAKLNAELVILEARKRGEADVADSLERQEAVRQKAREISEQTGVAPEEARRLAERYVAASEEKKAAVGGTMLQQSDRLTRIGGFTGGSQLLQDLSRRTTRAVERSTELLVDIRGGIRNWALQGEREAVLA